MNYRQQGKRNIVFTAQKSNSTAASHLLLSILFTLITIAYLPLLTQAATQRQKVVDQEKSQPINHYADSSLLDSIFELESDRNSSLKGNGLKQEDIDQIMKSNWIADAAATVFNSSQAQSSLKKPNKLK